MKTMKRIILSLAAVSVCALVLIGCGSTNADTPSKTEAPAADVDLSTANDTFQLPLLGQLLEVPDAAVVEMFGESEDSEEDASGTAASRSYDGVLFGQDITLTVYYEDELSAQADVVFDTEASLDQLADALSAELGNPSEDYAWESEGISYQLTDSDGTPTLTVTIAE